MKIIIDFGWIIKLFNSSFFAGFATILTGFIAWRIYLQQKNDEKVNAARVILSQIRVAEARLKQIRKRIAGQEFGDFPAVISTNYWEKYSYWFAKDFDQDELDEINSFFDGCEAIDEFARKDNEFFWITTEERARVIQQQLPQIIVAAYDQAKGIVDQAKLTQLKQTFLDVISNESYAYSPKKTVNNIELLASNISKLSTSTIGAKLKKIGKII